MYEYRVYIYIQLIKLPLIQQFTNLPNVNILVVGIKPKSLCLQAKCSTAEFPQPPGRAMTKPLSHF